MSFFTPSSVAMVTAAVRAEFHSIPSSMLSSDSAIWVMLPAREATSALSAAPGVPALSPYFAFRPPHTFPASFFSSRGQVGCACLLSTKLAKSKCCCFSLELCLGKALGLLEGKPRVLQIANWNPGTRGAERNQNKEGKKSASAQPPSSPCFIGRELCTQRCPNLSGNDCSGSKLVSKENGSDSVLRLWIKFALDPVCSHWKV